MGWSYRKSVHVGPFRLNLSKSGVGYSIGAKGFRVGVNARGRRYESVALPGTGLRYQTSGKSGCALLCVLLAALVAAGVHAVSF